jgi:predicted nucleic acid-binding protein
MNGAVIATIVLVVLVVAAVVLLLVRRQRTQRLRQRFGPEYDRTVEVSKDQSAAEKELRQREQRREQIQVVPLVPAARERYLEAWHRTQAQFVDSPTEATRQADKLVAEVMRERGYPVEDFEQRAADLSVDYPGLVQDYRAARTIADRNDRSEADTEELRQALVHYRSLFEELLEVAEDGKTDDSADHSVEEAR